MSELINRTRKLSEAGFLLAEAKKLIKEAISGTSLENDRIAFPNTDKMIEKVMNWEWTKPLS